jgi:ankyrin repeat protein
MTPLMWASQKGHSRVVEEVIAAGADFDHSGSAKGSAVLHWAAF